jgi:viroplasmin and RNaseH domain-containing protein
MVGIFRSWEECRRQVDGIYSEFKSFRTEDEARHYMAEGAKAVPPKPMKFKPHRRPGQSDAAFLKE